MSRRTIFRYLVLLILFQETATAQHVQTLRIDPAAAMGGPASQVVEEVSYISLETSKQSLFGSIDQLEVTAQHYIILDKQTNAVLVFDKSGAFHAKIVGKDLGYDDTHSLYAFFYDKHDKLIQIPFNGECFGYNTEGKLVTKRKVHNYGDILFNMSRQLTAYYAYRADPRWKDSVAYELTVTDQTGIVKKYLPYNMKLATPPSGDILHAHHIINFFPHNDTATFFLHPYDYTVYDLTPYEFRAAYRFLFPLSNTLPERFVTDSTMNGKRIQFLNEKKTVIYALSNFYQVGNNLVFKVLGATAESFVYNLSSGTLISIEKISPDQRSYFLPLTDAPSGATAFKNKGFLTADDQYLYTSYSANLLLREKEATAGKQPTYPAPLKEYFQRPKHEKDNPVIVKIKFKAAL